MQTGDRVYYRYTDSSGNQIKYAAVVLACRDDGIVIRIGRYDPGTQDIKTFESSVSADSLQPRSIPCSYEAILEGER